MVSISRMILPEVINSVIPDVISISAASISSKPISVAQVPTVPVKPISTVSISVKSIPAVPVSIPPEPVQVPPRAVENWKNQLDHAAQEVVQTIFHGISFSEFYYNKLIPHDFSDSYPNISRYIILILKDLEMGNISSFEIRLKLLPTKLRIATQAIAYEMAKVLALTSLQVRNQAERAMELLFLELNSGGSKNFSSLKWRSDVRALDALEEEIYRRSNIKNRQVKGMKTSRKIFMGAIAALAGAIYLDSRNPAKPKPKPVPPPAPPLPSSSDDWRFIYSFIIGAVATTIFASIRFSLIKDKDNTEEIEREMKLINFQPQDISVGELPNQYKRATDWRYRILLGQVAAKREPSGLGRGLKHLGWSMLASIHRTFCPLPIVVVQTEVQIEGVPNRSVMDDPAAFGEDGKNRWKTARDAETRDDSLVSVPPPSVEGVPDDVSAAAASDPHSRFR